MDSPVTQLQPSHHHHQQDDIDLSNLRRQNGLLSSSYFNRPAGQPFYMDPVAACTITQRVQLVQHVYDNRSTLTQLLLPGRRVNSDVKPDTEA